MDKFKVTFRMVLLVLSILSATSVHSQIRSDEKTGCYTDNTLHFHWYLPASLKWQFQPGMESHTVFRAEAKCGITAIVNVRPIDGLEGELSQEKRWKYMAGVIKGALRCVETPGCIWTKRDISGIWV